MHETNREIYREFEVKPASYPPGWWEGTHPEYDGPEDRRYFVMRTRAEVLDSIDDYWDW